MIPLPTLEAKQQLMQKQIEAKTYEGIYKGFIASFMPDKYGYSQTMLDCAEEFASKASKEIAAGIAGAIDMYVKSLVVNVPAAPQASLVAGPVPVTGTVAITDPLIMIG